MIPSPNRRVFCGLLTVCLAFSLDTCVRQCLHLSSRKTVNQRSVMSRVHRLGRVRIHREKRYDRDDRIVMIGEAGQTFPVLIKVSVVCRRVL